MMELTMFQKLQQLPLLQGLNNSELQDLVSIVRLEFQQKEQEDIIAEQNDSCQRITFLLSGSVRAEFHEPSGQYIFSEIIDSPSVIEPYSMFGMVQRYTRSYICHTECSTITIERKQFINIMMNNHIIKANMLNLICNSLQQMEKKLHLIYDQDTTTKVAYFFYTCALTNKGQKHIYIKMETLADIIGETRLNVSRSLKTFREAGLLTSVRKSFTITDMNELITRYVM
ncbi:MAG: Crp/Fnr family transcriptional regulator [Bacteroidaceae bacterium]|nr:Crp/Fnr family transcriptional regulator [Bacteroidaceae bacterium]